MTVIEVSRPARRGYPATGWQPWRGWPPAEAAIQEARVALLKAFWPQWRWRVVPTVAS